MTFELVKPGEDYIDEIRSYRLVFLADGVNSAGDCGLRKFEDINEWLVRCRLMESEKTVPSGLVEAEQYMLLRDGGRRVYGMINFRHYLSEYLAEYAGHIGYAVRPSERRRGYAKAMLALCLEKCRERGLERVLVTCDADNEASRRTIISCGGVFDRNAVDKPIERYFITL